MVFALGRVVRGLDARPGARGRGDGRRRGSVIFFCLFVVFSCVQFWTSDASEFANAFTYGGNTITQYPLTVFPRELVKSLTFVLPLAFVNWYPCLYLLGRPDPFGLPSWLQFASPVPRRRCSGC